MDVSIARVTRIGGLVNGVYSDLANLGGPVLQARSLREFDTSCPIVGEVVPPQANYVSLRITTPLFGAGLIEAIPDATILATINEASKHIADEGTRRALEGGVAASLKSMQAKAGEGFSMSLEAPRQG